MILAVLLLTAAGTAVWACVPAQPVRGTAPDAPPVKAKGDPAAGRNVFRFETLGTERFWTDAVRLPQGLAAEKVTPLGLLDMGLSLDAEALPADLKEAFAAEFKTDGSADKAPKLNDPAATAKLIAANAVIGLVPKGGKVGVTCALCHTITDGSAFEVKGKGSVGKRLDGRTAHHLNLGRLFASAANSRALYPLLQLQDGNKTIGRAPKGLTADSTEKEVDAYFRNPEFYPVGTLDSTFDGHGNGTVIMPVFRQDLAAPFSSGGESLTFADSANRTFTAFLDLTVFLTPEGRAFLKMTNGDAGLRIADDYAKVLKDTGVTGYPFVTAKVTGEVGKSPTPLGRRVDEKKLTDLTAFCEGLAAPPGVVTDAAAVERGRKLFEANCTKCHNVDALKPVPPTIVDMKTLFPGYAPKILADRKSPQSAVQDAPGGFDDHVVVFDASGGGKPRGFALPLLLDLARKPVFLHDGSVKGLDALFDPARGETAPHPVYVKEAGARADVVAFLKSLGSKE